MTEVFFSKTEENKDGTWTATIAPKCHTNYLESKPMVGHKIYAGQHFNGKIIHKRDKVFPNQIIIEVEKGFPCVGILHQLK